MGLFSSNYAKPGPGIDKNAPRKKGLALYYELLFRKFWKLMGLNLLYLVTLLPTFLAVFYLAGLISNQIGQAYSQNLAAGLGLSAPDIQNVEYARLSISVDLLVRLGIAAAFAVLWGGGPATAGLSYITRCYVQEEPTFLFSDYFGSIAANWKQALIVWIIDLAAFTVFYYAYVFYGSLPSIAHNLKYVIGVLAVFYTLLHLFLYHLLVTYKLKLGALYKNAALFVLASLPKSIFTLAVLLFFLILFPAFAVFSQIPALATAGVILTVLFAGLLLYSLCGFTVQFHAAHQVEKYKSEDTDVQRKETPVKKRA